MRNKNGIMKKVVSLCMTIGALHVCTCSFGIGYYEPKISPELLKNQINKEK